jgi:hypothetical protein
MPRKQLWIGDTWTPFFYRTNLTFRHHIPEIDQGEPKMREAETIGRFARKAAQ